MTILISNHFICNSFQIFKLNLWTIIYYQDSSTIHPKSVDAQRTYRTDGKVRELHDFFFVHAQTRKKVSNHPNEAKSSEKSAMMA